jgi:hypothetical protein
MTEATMQYERARPAARGTLRGSKGVFSYLVPANSLTVVRVAR